RVGRVRRYRVVDDDVFHLLVLRRPDFARSIEAEAFVRTPARPADHGRLFEQRDTGRGDATTRAWARGCIDEGELQAEWRDGIAGAVQHPVTHPSLATRKDQM